ncbi:MAG: 50S ribosomal protein L1 [Chlamydiae bacterium]|nr:MAG: 50S ribosomal protein L1 [Chlamydiota bacterium]
MNKKNKRHKENSAKVENKLYTLNEAVELAIQMKAPKFVESIDLNSRLGIDPKKADQAVRGTVALPHGTGKKIRVLAFATGADADAAKEAGADFVGYEDLIKKIKDGWTDFDIAIASPATMREVGKIGRVLGPRGLMPSPKAGTVTQDVGTAVTEFKSGKVEFRADKQAGIHCPVGKVNFTAEQITDNICALVGAILKLKPSAAKGTYLQKISISTTMGPGIRIDPNDAESMALKK